MAELIITNVSIYKTIAIEAFEAPLDDHGGLRVADSRDCAIWARRPVAAKPHDGSWMCLEQIIEAVAGNRVVVYQSVRTCLY